MPDRQKLRSELANAHAQVESEEAALFFAARRLFPELGSNFTSTEIWQSIISHCAIRHQLRGSRSRYADGTAR